MYKLVLFDFDGTILDSDQMLYETFKELHKMYKTGKKILPSDTIKYSGPPIKESLKKEFPNLDEEMTLKDYLRISVTNYERYVHLFPGVEDMLIALREKKAKFGLITSKNREATNMTFSLLGIEGYFPLSICFDEVSIPKPSPEGILLAMRHFNVLNPKEVIYVGDGLIDYVTARNAGVDFALVGYSPRKESIPLDDVDLIINDWNDLLEATYEEN